MAEERLNASAANAATTALDQNRAVAAQLSVTARKLRFSTSNRSRIFKAVGLRPRMIERLAKMAAIGLTVFWLVIPNTASIIYYTVFASDQYQSETRFTVSSSAPALGKDQLGKVTGLPAAKIAQDTQIVTNYITSKEMVNTLQQKLDFRQIYGNDHIDSLSRLEKDATAESIEKYWEKMVTTKISPTSGIVTVTVRAFSPEDSQKVLNEVVAASEVVVNDVNRRIWQDVIQTAQANLDRAKDQLQKTREQLQNSRNQSGMLTVESSATVISSLVTTAEQEKIDLQQRYNTQLTTVSPDAPQMRVLKREIASKEQQIAELNKQIAGQSSQAAGSNDTGQNLADVSVDMSQRQLEQTLAEQQFASSVKTLEQVQFVSRQQLMYLDAFLAPNKPDEAEYPKRGLYIAGIFAATLAIWGISLGFLAMLRNHFN